MAWEDVTAQSKAACSPASVWGTQKVKLYRELQWVSLLPDTGFQEKKEQCFTMKIALGIFVELFVRVL